MNTIRTEWDKGTQSLHKLGDDVITMRNVIHYESGRQLLNYKTGSHGIVIADLGYNEDQKEWIYTVQFDDGGTQDIIGSFLINRQKL